MPVGSRFNEQTLPHKNKVKSDQERNLDSTSGLHIHEHTQKTILPYSCFSQVFCHNKGKLTNSVQKFCQSILQEYMSSLYYDLPSLRRIMLRSCRSRENLWSKVLYSTHNLKKVLTFSEPECNLFIRHSP